MTNIVEVVGADKNLVTMKKGLKASGLESELEKGGPYTIFAPSEIAFGKLPGGSFEELLKPENTAKLAGILNDHIVAGKVKFSDLKNGQKLKARSGKDLDVSVINGLIAVNGATVQARDIEATNGFVHSLDKVLIPVEQAN